MQKHRVRHGFASRLRLLLASSVGVGLALGAGVNTAAAQDPSGVLRVEVVSGPMGVPGAEVSVNGVTATTDATGLARLTLPAGSVSVMATKDGYEMGTGRVDVVRGAERTARVVLAPIVPGEDTVVASTRTGRRIGDETLPISLLGRTEIEDRMLNAPGDIATLFNGMVGLRPQTTSTVLGTAAVRVRGLPSHYTRILADGAPLYGDRPGGHAPLRIPPMDISHVEVIKEPASALFGSDAVAVINLLSQRAGSVPNREFLFNQSASGATDAMFWLASPPGRSWSTTLLAGAHRQSENDIDDDGWSDLPGYQRIVARPRVDWNNGRGRSVSGVAGVTFEEREGGSDFAREELETKTAEGALSGQMLLDSGYIIGGSAVLFVQSRTHDFSDRREGDRFQTATIELTLRRPSGRNTWLAGIASDWYALRSGQDLPSTYVSTRPGIFVQDDLTVSPWLLVSGSARLDHHNLYGFLLSPRGSALVRSGSWSARVSAAQGYFTPRPFMEETEAAGLDRLTIDDPLELETARTISGEVTRRGDAGEVTIAVFRSEIENPGQIDRTTYTLRTETEPIVSQGVELVGTLRYGPGLIVGNYAYIHTREHGDRDLALTPRHRAGVTASADASEYGRLGVELSYTGTQRLDANPYRSTSESYVLLNLFFERQFGQRWGLFFNAQNLTNVHQTHWDPIARPEPDVDGRWTVDAWAPLVGRMFNFGVKVSF